MHDDAIMHVTISCYGVLGHLLSEPTPLPSPPLLFLSSPLQRKGPAAAEDGEGDGREQLCEGLTGAAAAREVGQQPTPPHREPPSEGAGK